MLSAPLHGSAPLFANTQLRELCGPPHRHPQPCFPRDTQRCLYYPRSGCSTKRRVPLLEGRTRRLPRRRVVRGAGGGPAQASLRSRSQRNRVRVLSPALSKEPARFPPGSVLHSPWILLPEVRAVQMWSPRTSCLTCRAQVPHLSTALARKERGEQAACQSALDSGCTTWSSRSSSFEMEMPGSQNGPVTATPSQEVEQSAFNGRPADQNIPVGSRHRSPTC